MGGYNLNVGEEDKDKTGQELPLAKMCSSFTYFRLLVLPKRLPWNCLYHINQLRFQRIGKDSWTNELRKILKCGQATLVDVRNIRRMA